PWDPVANSRYRLHDAVLFRGRYYLLHLPGPAVVLFLPWRLATGHDLPQNFALFLFGFGGFLFSSAALIRLLHLAGLRFPPAVIALALPALAFCQGVPYLLSSIRMYEVAIGGGYLFISAGLYCLVRVAANPSVAWCAGAGTMFGAAMSCRPHFALASIAA